jgi:hypothetical protein
VHDLLLRLYTSPSTHRLLPAAVAVPLVAALQPPWRRLRNPAEDVDVQRLMSDLLQYTPRAGEARKAARRYHREQSRLRELFWRPWLLKRSRVHGREHWDAAHAGGSGCVMVLGHLAGSWAVSGILGRQGFDVRMVASAHFWEEPVPGIKGLTHRHLREEYGERALGSHRLISNSAPPEEIVQLLEDGATLGIAFDVPGSASTPFLGRSVSLTSGPATLSCRTRAKVLPVITERHGTRMDLRMLTPLDPADFGDVRSLRAAIARTYEPFLIDKPEIIELAWSPSPLITETLAPHEPYVPTAPRMGGA